jgi:hypothetical protein
VSTPYVDALLREGDGPGPASGSGVAGGSGAAVPVDLALRGRHADAVRRHVEGVLGWQPVDAATAALVPPAVRLCDHLDVPDAAVDRGARAGAPTEAPSVPTVLVLDDAAAPEEVATLVRAHDPVAVIAWPSGRDRLATEVTAVLARPRVAPSGVRTLRVGGAAGGVGTTTVALTLAGLSAWQGSPTLAVVRPPVPVTDVRAVPAAGLASGDLWQQASPLSGTGPGRAVAVLGGGDRLPPVTDPAIRALVVDVGVDADVDVLVCRPDAAARDALQHTTAAAIVLVGTGAVRPRALLAAARGRRTVHLPWSARVARAGATGRVPAGLPGDWVRRLLPLAPSRPGSRAG